MMMARFHKREREQNKIKFLTQRRGRRRCRERMNETNERTKREFFLEGAVTSFFLLQRLNCYMEKVLGPVVLHWLSNHRPAVNVFFKWLPLTRISFFILLLSSENTVAVALVLRRHDQVPSSVSGWCFGCDYHLQSASR